MTIRWRALGAAVSDAQPVWVLLGGIAAAWAVAWLIGRLFATTGDAAVRWAGMMLQLLGLAAVAYGLRQTRKLFDAPTVLGQARGWFGRLRRAFLRPEPITLEAAAAGGVALVGGRVRLRHGVGAGATVEQRLAALEANLKSFEEESDQTTSELSSKIGRLEKALQRERGDREVADDKTWKQIEEVSIGGLHLEVVGLMWLVLGVVGTSIPDELADLLARIVSR